MAIPRFAWGIDIGNRALKAVKLVRDNDTLRVDDIDVIEHEQVLSNSGDNREGLIQAALANFAQRHVTKNGIVAVGVSGQSSFARFIKLPPVEKNKIPEIVKFEAIQQIPFPLDEVEWSYQLFEDPESPDVEVGIFAMKKELVNQQIKYFTDMDMNVQVVQMNPLAVYNAMYFDSRLQDGTTMILDLGAENADLIIADGESVWLRSIAIGGNNFTEALVKAFKLNFAKAEELKRNAQTSKYARQIFQAMRPVFADLVAEIQRSIGFYSSVHRDSRIKRIIALGNTFRLPTLQKYLQQNLQIDVERLDGFSAGAPEDGRQAALLNENVTSMAGAYGLALQAMGQGKITSSLLPLEIRRAKVWREKTKWFAGAAAIMLAAAGLKFGVYYYHNDQFESRAEDRTKIDASLQRADTLSREWAKLENAGEPAKATIHNVRAMTQYRDLWADLLLDVTKVLPADTATAPDKIKSTPRAKRQQVFIDGIYSKYHNDIGSLVKMSAEEFRVMANSLGPVQAQQGGVGTGEGPVPRGAGRTNPERGGGGEESAENTTAAAVPGGPRGFLVKIQCTSPTDQASRMVETVVLKQLMDRLSETAALKDKKLYFVARAMIVSAQQIGQDDARKAVLKSAADQKRQAKDKFEQTLQGGATGVMNFGGGGGGGAVTPRITPAPRSEGIRPPNPEGMRGGGVGTVGIIGRSFPVGGVGAGGDAEKNEKDEKEAYADPLFPEENVLNDWQIDILLVIGLEPKPAQPGGGGGENPPPPSEENPNQQATNDPEPADRKTVVAK